MSKNHADPIWSRPTRPARRGIGIGIGWKIIGGLLGTVLLVDLLAVALVYYYVERALRGQIEQRALTIAMNLSAASAGYVATRNILPLDAILAQYALLDGVAYVFVRDRGGEVLSHRPRAFPVELRASITPGTVSQPQKRALTFEGKGVYETVAPMMDGQIGAVHIGLWARLLEEQLRETMLPIIALFAALLAAGIALSAFLALRLIKPLKRLRTLADAMSQGDLDTSLRIDSRDEISEIAVSLERMRMSLKAAMVRLTRSSAPNGADDARPRGDADRG